MDDSFNAILARSARKYDTTFARATCKALGIEPRKPRRRRYEPTEAEILECLANEHSPMDGRLDG